MSTPKPTPRRRPKAELISCHGIAMELKRSARGVSDAIERLGLEPEQDLPGGRYYRREAIETVRRAMRAGNKPATTTTSTPDPA